MQLYFHLTLSALPLSPDLPHGDLDDIDYIDMLLERKREIQDKLQAISEEEVKHGPKSQEGEEEAKELPDDGNQDEQNSLLDESCEQNDNVSYILMRIIKQ